MLATLGLFCAAALAAAAEPEAALAAPAEAEGGGAHAAHDPEPQGPEEDHFVAYLKQYLPPGDYKAYVQQWVGQNASWHQYVDQYSNKMANYTGYIDQYGGQQADYDQYVALYSSMAGSQPSSGQNWQGKRGEQVASWGKAMKGTMGVYVPGAFNRYAEGPMQARAASGGNGGYQRSMQGHGRDDQPSAGGAPAPLAALAMAAAKEPDAGTQRPAAKTNATQRNATTQRNSTAQHNATAPLSATQLRQRAEAELARMEAFERDLRHAANATHIQQDASRGADKMLAQVQAGLAAALADFANCSDGEACANYVADAIRGLHSAARRELQDQISAGRRAAKAGQEAVRRMAREVRNNTDAWARTQPGAEALADQLDRRAEASADASERLLEAVARLQQDAWQRAAQRVRSQLEDPTDVAALPEQPWDEQPQLQQPQQPQQTGQPAPEAAPLVSSGGHFLARTATSAASPGGLHLPALLGALACTALAAHALQRRVRAPAAVLMPENVLG